MASRRYRAKNSLNSNISYIDTRLSNIETRPAPRRIGANTVTAFNIQNQSLNGDLFSDDAGTLLGPGAVTLVHIGDLSINQDKIMDDAVTELKLAANSISEAKIQVNAITSAVIAANAITSEKILAGAVLTDAISPEAITTAKIAAAAITANTIAANAIITSKIAAGAVVANSIAANAIVAEKIAANAITAEKITANAITTEKINANAITAEKIAANTITAREISSEYVYANNITGNQILGGTITGVTVQTLNTGSGSVELNSTNRAIQFRDGSGNVFMNMYPGAVGGGSSDQFYLQYGTTPDYSADNALTLGNNSFALYAGSGNNSVVSGYANNARFSATGSYSSIDIEANGTGSVMNLYSTSTMSLISSGAVTVTGSNVTLGSTGALALNGQLSCSGGTFNGTALVVGSGSTYIRCLDTYTRNTTGGLDVRVASNGTYFSVASSRRFKQNIENYSVNKSAFLQMQPVTYKYKQEVEELGDAAGTAVGYIAEDLDALGLEEYVIYDADGNPHGIEYRAMVVALQNIVVEQDQTIVSLSNRLATLEARLDAAGL